MRRAFACERVTGLLDRLAVPVADGDALARQHRPVAVLEIGDGVGEGRKRDGIRADEHLAVAIADGERAALARDDHEIVIAGEDHGESERALEPPERVEHRVHRIVAGLELARDEMGDDLGVGVGGEHRAFRRELGLELAEILDDAVMHDRHEVGHMRVGVGLDRLAMRRPARVADTGRAHQRLGPKLLLEIAQLAFGASPREMAVLDGGDASRIVTAIFETLQRVDKLLRDRPFAENANDAAHRPYSRLPLHLAKRPISTPQLTSYVPLFPSSLALPRPCRSRARAAQPLRSSCGARLRASASASTSLEMTLPDPI